jgi:hypothetical protein
VLLTWQVEIRATVERDKVAHGLDKEEVNHNGEARLSIDFIA